jgi:hypothetical protein
MNQKSKSGFAGGIFLIGLGILIITNAWWPGIMFVLGLAAGADRVLRGKYLQGLTAFALFAAVSLFSAVDIPWRIFGPFILISLGVVALVQALTSSHVQS